MLYPHYDTQSSFEGYIDMEFKELKNYPKVGEYCSGYPITDTLELMEFIEAGYYYDGKVPVYMEKVFDWEGDIKKARVSRRLLKLWCSKMTD